MAGAAAGAAAVVAAAATAVAPTQVVQAGPALQAVWHCFSLAAQGRPLILVVPATMILTLKAEEETQMRDDLLLPNTMKPAIAIDQATHSLACRQWREAWRATTLQRPPPQQLVDMGVQLRHALRVDQPRPAKQPHYPGRFLTRTLQLRRWALLLPAPSWRRVPPEPVALRHWADTRTTKHTRTHCWKKM